MSLVILSTSATARPRRSLSWSMIRAMAYVIGTAGWTIPKVFVDRFPAEGSHLQRYAERLNGVEINSSFYRPHQPKTYKRWAEETHDDLRFSVKMTKIFTHERKLDVEDIDLELWLGPVKELGPKLGALLVQIPPKLEFDRGIANSFFKNLRELTDVMIALEPRHISWTAKDAQGMLDFYDVTKVEADPERCPTPPKRDRARYLRLHGTPDIYKSSYEPKRLKKWAEDLKGSPDSWVIFDNTAWGHATGNALDLRAQLATDSSSSRKLSRRKRGATKNMATTVTKLTEAPKTAD
jgi:uncharacterized protein YecE (DUF72 family)